MSNNIRTFKKGGMMFFWIRELIGWTLLAVALYLISIALRFAEDRQVIQAGIVVFSSIAVMRMSVLLIRMNTAARIFQQSNETE
ncbi:MAG: hypothetical protein MK110_08345 [Fuerstiella sp.]|nr:hypothetical protein [Fuerstiella sp.]